MTIPPYLRSFFWDINTDNFDPASYPEYTIFRLLEYGNEEAVGWLKENFSEEQIRDVIRTERRLSRRSANYWALIYNIPAQEVEALKEPVS